MRDIKYDEERVYYYLYNYEDLIDSYLMTVDDDYFTASIDVGKVLPHYFRGDSEQYMADARYNIATRLALQELTINDLEEV